MKEFFQKNLWPMLSFVFLITAFAFYVRSEKAIVRAEQNELLQRYVVTINQTNQLLGKINFPNNSSELSKLGVAFKQLGYNIYFEKPIINLPTKQGK